MKRNFLPFLSLLIVATATSTTAFAGNPDRAGSAGAGQLLINPWSLSTGLAGSNMATITGVEAGFLNVAGMAFVDRTELAFSNQQFMVGTGIMLNSLGFVQAMGSGVLGVTVTSMSFGDIPITTEDLPEGGIGSFSPSFSNIGISYAKAFSESIYAGMTLRIISESISNVRAGGVSIDAGIRYLAGDDGRLKFGISLRNVGTPLRYGGDGMSLTATPQDQAESLTLLVRSERFELPSLVNIGFGYDIFRKESLTLIGTGQFTSNSFTKDNFSGGLELDFKERVQLRVGYQHEDGIGDKETRTNVYTGPSAGFSAKFPNESGGSIGIHYGYRTTNPFDGTHSIGFSISI
jgi:hypothetical protein